VISGFFFLRLDLWLVRVTALGNPGPAFEVHHGVLTALRHCEGDS